MCAGTGQRTPCGGTELRPAPPALLLASGQSGLQPAHGLVGGSGQGIRPLASSRPESRGKFKIVKNIQIPDYLYVVARFKFCSATTSRSARVTPLSRSGETCGLWSTDTRPHPCLREDVCFQNPHGAEGNNKGLVKVRTRPSSSTNDFRGVPALSQHLPTADGDHDQQPVQGGLRTAWSQCQRRAPPCHRRCTPDRPSWCLPR